ncbi:neuropeptide FF receptor 2 [Elysia marginata]|uniref:Neuropeptide FF receptor 2 n=1 Tax=Elysia marginata TaxID=1093978 RepID=A0AAV4IHN9_9GAST|nr:neuropeptide FF receptor 2 [Elysia marginata]
MTAIAFTMMAIAGDRFFAIVFPFKARVTQSKVKVVLAIVWLCAISISIPPLVFYRYFERRWKDYTETFCTDIWPAHNCDYGVRAERVYWTVVVAVLNWLPMLMMTINYSVIIHRLSFMRVAHTGSDTMTALQKRSARRVVKMMFALLIAFMVCTIPFQVSTMYENYKDRKIKLPDWFDPVYFTAINLMYAHSAINPIIYGALNQTFRVGFKELINRCRKGSQQKRWQSRMTSVDNTRPARLAVIDTAHTVAVEEAEDGGYANIALDGSPDESRHPQHNSQAIRRENLACNGQAMSRDLPYPYNIAETPMDASLTMPV